ncbi:acyl-CoA carboxylase epsilon subunit [Streptomyces sp. NPDC047002]|uniref:acyl-CoA carboxylase epsilon subunit n=1 Tax=Streptomyces sp. NPDC047002 TaxID=3155475 RepID=UPI0034516FAC
MIKVIRGNPTPEELAAAVAVVQARAAGTAGTEPPPPGGRAEWAAPARIARTRVPSPGPRSWAHTYWPR